MTTAYTIGATIGPVLGGYLAEVGGMYFAAKLAVFGSLLSVLLSLLYLPAQNRTTTPQNIEQDRPRPNRTFIEEVLFILSIALRRNLLLLLVAKVVGGIAASMYQTTLPVVLTQDLKIDPSSLGILMSSSMLATALFGAVGIGPLMKFLRASGMAYNGFVLRAVLGCIMAYAISAKVVDNHFMIWASLRNQIVGISVLHALASHSIATGLTTQTTGVVAPNEQGTLLGLEHGLFSLARVVGPPAGTNLLLQYGFVSVAVLCGIIDIVLMALLKMTHLRTSSDDRKNNKDNITDGKKSDIEKTLQEEKTK
jgi:MFS family permease